MKNSSFADFYRKGFHLNFIFFPPDLWEAGEVKKLMNPVGLLSAGGAINSTIKSGLRRLLRARFHFSLHHHLLLCAFSQTPSVHPSLSPRFLLTSDRHRRHCSNFCKTLNKGGSEKLLAMSHTQDMAVRDYDLLKKKKAAIREAGPSKLQVGSVFLSAIFCFIP